MSDNKNIKPGMIVKYHGYEYEVIEIDEDGLLVLGDENELILNVNPKAVTKSKHQNNHHGKNN